MNAPAIVTARADTDKWRLLAEHLFNELRARTSDERGVTRECYADGENVALDLFRETAEAHGLKCSFDRGANLLITLPDDDLSRRALILGSHADSVPQGGNFDGAAGVVAALISLIRYKDERVSGLTPPRVLVMRGEESAYYGRANMGSRALFGLINPSDLDAKRQGAGRTLREAMQSVGADVKAIAAGEKLLSENLASSYLELHIEQGPIMVSRELPTAIVTGVRGNLRHRRIVCEGEAGHSGTVPRWLRRDPMFAVADLIMRLDEHWKTLLERGLDLAVTTGICSTERETNAISRIPGEVNFSFEVRSQSYETLEGFYELFRSECRAIAEQRKVTFRFDDRVYTEPAKMDEAMIARLVKVSQKLNLPTELLASGAGHDAAVFANGGTPSAMIFVRNSHGSHNPDEAMAIEDFMCGVELMYAFISTGGRE